jgi:hypothetical protein
MKVFETGSQLASWSGICPGNNESAGKRKSSHYYGQRVSKNGFGGSGRCGLKARRGYKRAMVAVAHKILVAIYHMFSHQVCYNELGDLYLDKLNKHSLTRNLVHRLERLGYTVTLVQKAA